MKTLSNLRLVLFISTISVIICACQFPNAETTSAENESADSKSSQPYEVSANAEANIALVQKFLDAQIVGDGETMRSLMSSDFLSRNPAGDTLYLQQYITNWEMINDTRSDQDLGIFATNSQTVTEGPLAGEWVMFWGSYSAVGLEDQVVYEILWHADFLISQDKISRIVSYFDMVDPSEEDAA